jgi:OFA family oxalate/formate antiporter-like MFS transporter
MSQVTLASGEAIENHGWRNTFAGLGINLALGILYTWSVISKGIPEEWEWTQSDKSMPYAIACLVFSIVMVPAGRMQDKMGPRIVATIGGILVGIGMIVASFTSTPLGYMLGFGVLAGAGIGFGYASATPAAVKWFPAKKTGLIAGIVVSGFGLASVYAAPLAQWLLNNYGISVMLQVLGVGFLIVVVALAQFLKVPHVVLQFMEKLGDVGRKREDAEAGKPVIKENDFSPGEMLKTKQFYLLWFMYACGAGAGLMIISVAKKIVAAVLAAMSAVDVTDVAQAAEATKAAERWALAAVVGLAIGNGGGRILAGFLSDKIGRKITMFVFFVFQAILLVVLSQAEGTALASAPCLILIVALIGANYGSNLALFPSITKDFFGLKNFGMNYGLVFTAWGVGGFMLAKLAGIIFDKTQSFNFAYFCASGLLVVAAIVVLLVKPPHHPTDPA